MINLTDSSLSKRTIILIPVLLVAFYLRLDELGNGPVRWDEAFSVWEAQMGFIEGTDFTARDVHPPLYFWFLHLWVRMTDSSEFAIRLLSVFPSLITIPVVYAITHRLSRQRLAALIAMLLITTSPYHIHWSQDARMYALATMFASLTIYANLRSRTRLFAISGIGAVMSHYYGLIVVCIILIYDVITRREVVRHRQWYAAIAVISAVFIVWGAYTIGLMRKDPSFATFDPQAAFVLMANVYAVNATTHHGAYAFHVLLMTSIFFAGLLLSWRGNPRATTFVIMGCLLPPTIITLLGLPIIPVHVNALQERHVSIFAPFVFTGFGIGLAAMLRMRWLRLVGATIVMGLLVFNGSLVMKRADKRYFKDDYRSMMGAVAALTTEDDRVYYTSGGRKPLVYYHLDRVGYDVPKNNYAEPINVIGIPRRSADVDAMMQEVFGGISRFWLIQIEAHLDEPLDARINWINENYYRVYHFPVAWNGVSLYSRDEYETAPDIAAILPPVITEARPADQVRIGVPAGMKVDLVHSGQVIDTHSAETWMLHQFDIYSFYFNGDYALHAGDERYPFVITHSRDFPGGT